MENIVVLPLSRLHESPTNPRKTFGDAGMQELAESIDSQGLLQPIVVRPIISSDGQEADHQYEIVFGHRRFRAADIAGMGEIPCIVRALTDHAAAIAQLHENLEREDVHPIEEAEAFQRLMTEHGVSADQLAEQTGKSRTYIYNRLKLATLTNEVRKECMSGLFGAEIATLIARVPKPLQHDALKRCTYQDHSKHDAPIVARSYRDCRDQLRASFTQALDIAPFSTADATLITEAGSCLLCPRRSDNDPALLELGADICTNITCFAAKKIAHVDREISQARDAGLLIDGTLDRNRHTPLESIAWQGLVDGNAFRRIRFRDMLESPREDGAAWPPVYLIAPTGGTPIECLLKDAANAIEADLSLKMDGEVAHTPSTAAAAAADLRPDELAVTAHKHWRAVRLAIMTKIQTTPRTLEDLRMIALRELEMSGGFGLAETAIGWADELDGIDIDDFRAWRRDKLMDMSADELGALLTMVSIDESTAPHGPAVHARAANRLDLARRYGVDVLAVTGHQEQPDEAGDTGPERDPNTADMFDASDV